MQYPLQGFQLKVARGAEPTGGYLGLSRLDLPRLQERLTESTAEADDDFWSEGDDGDGAAGAAVLRCCPVAMALPAQRTGAAPETWWRVALLAGPQTRTEPTRRAVFVGGQIVDGSVKRLVSAFIPLR